ncbi:MAG: beta-propeller fold [Verrucomicrobia bacterium]|nr:MAG: beta-propeller fold [Verrucomicrobiota bacterium]
MRTFLFAVGFFLVAFAGQAEPVPSLPDSAMPLFDGKSTAGWDILPGSVWGFADGVLTGGDGQKKIPYNDFICTKTSHSNFILRLKLKLTGDPSTGMINSGVQIRSHRVPGNHEVSGYQCDYGEPTWYGAIYDESRRNKLIAKSDMEALRPALKVNAWNEYVIKADGPRIQTWINGVQGTDFTEAEANIASDGIIGVQVHGGGNAVVQIKDVFIQNLPPTPNAPTWDGLGGVEGQRAKLNIPVSAARVTARAGGGRFGPEVASINPADASGRALNLGFETGDLRDWKAEGNAWEAQPVQGDTVRPRKPSEQSNHVGEYWLGGYERAGDLGTGTLTSVAFEVKHPWASFLVGGGSDLNKTRVEIVEEATGKVIKAAAGANREDMRREVLDLRALVGRQIFIRIVDTFSGGWGHVNYDDFVFHTKEPELTLAAAVAAGPAAAAQGAAANVSRSTRQKESPVLKHLVANPAKPTAVANADGQQVIASMMLTPGFQAELLAAEPEVKQPIAFAIDERGRLWIAEAFSYPKKRKEGKSEDRILILEDTKGDGSFDKRTVFFEGLNLVSGLEVGFGGVWVGAAPELIFIPRDANDKAGKPEVLLDGWGFQDTHETLNSFSWGPDGWLYGNQGVFTRSQVGKPGTPDDKRVDFRSGVWRYHPVRHEFELFAHGGSNQWGLDFNSNGHLFMTHCRSFWGGGGTTYVIRNGHFWNQANGNYAPFISNTGPEFAPHLKNFLPAAARYDSGVGGAGKAGSDSVYGGHSHVGTMIYLGDNWPENYRNHLFTNNLFGHQMNHQVNERKGSAYETVHAGHDLLIAPDPRYMAVDLQTGPDGAVYLIDWCDLQHCHTPADEKWDRTNGRVYRVSWAETFKPVKVDLGIKSDVELARLHTHRNDWYSRQARNLLQYRKTERPIEAEAVRILAEQTRSTDTALALRAVWTLHVIGGLDGAALETLAKAPDDVLRAWAVQLATERSDAPALPSAILLALAKDDPSPTVRLALASAMPQVSKSLAWDLGSALAAHGEDADDRFLPRMVWCGLGRIAGDDLQRVLNIATTTPLQSLADSILWFAARTEKGREHLLSFIAQRDDASAARILRIMAFALKDEAALGMPAGWNAARTRLLHTKDRDLEDAADSLSALFGDKEIVAKLRNILADDQAPEVRRHFAFEQLRRVDDAESLPLFAKLLENESLRSVIIPLLARAKDPSVAEALLKRFASLNMTDQGKALTTLTARAELAAPLLRAMKQGAFERKYVSSLHVRQMRNLKNAEIDRLLDEAWGKVNDSSDAAKETMARLKKGYLAAPLLAYDVNAGAETFKQLCGVCHAMNGQGGNLGPDLGGSWRHGLDYFLENIVDPNAVVGENFQLHVITKKDGTVVSGLLDQESPTAVTLRTLGLPVVTAKSEISKHEKLAQSLMPAGLLEGLPEQKAFELLKFLTSK